MIGYDKKRKTYFVQYKTKGNDGKWHTTMKRGFKLRRLAVEYEAQLKLDKPVTVDSKTFRIMWQLWEDNIQSSQATRTQHDENFRIRFSEYLDKDISRISRSQLSEWRSNLANTNYSTRTKNTTIRLVKAVFRFANEVYNVPNTAIILKPFKRTDTEIMNDEMEVWTVAEFEKFRDAIDNKLYRIYFDTLFWTGARRGEIIALQCEDLLDGYISIHASQRNATQGLKPTKTKITRKVKLDSKLYAELLELKDYYKSGYLFGGETALSPTTIDRHFRKGIADSGVKPIRLHDLRHSHATWLINNGVNIVAVSKRLGHTDIETTLKTYTHLLEDTDKQMMQIIEKEKN